MASIITMTNTDPGEGSPLQSDNFLAVYGGQSLLDIFYPVGCYFETSDEDFDPNVVWGGIWEEDTGGRVTVAQDAGTFDTVGATGGQEDVRLSAAIGSGQSDAQSLAFIAENVNAYMSARKSTYKVNGSSYNTSTNWSHSTPVTEFSKNVRNTTILQPYIVVKRWHRVN